MVGNRYEHCRLMNSGEVKRKRILIFYSKTNEMHQFLKFILFCSSTLHVSDGLSVHHQESKTVHTASSKSTNQMQQFLKFIT